MARPCCRTGDGQARDGRTGVGKPARGGNGFTVDLGATARAIEDEERKERRKDREYLSLAFVVIQIAGRRSPML